MKSIFKTVALIFCAGAFVIAIGIGAWLAYQYSTGLYCEFKNRESNRFGLTWNDSLKLSSIKGRATYDVFLELEPASLSRLSVQPTIDSKVPEKFAGAIIVVDMENGQSIRDLIPVEFVATNHISFEGTRIASSFRAHGQFEDENGVLEHFHSMFGAHVYIAPPHKSQLDLH